MVCSPILQGRLPSIGRRTLGCSELRKLAQTHTAESGFDWIPSILSSAWAREKAPSSARATFLLLLHSLPCSISVPSEDLYLVPLSGEYKPYFPRNMALNGGSQVPMPLTWRLGDAKETSGSRYSYSCLTLGGIISKCFGSQHKKAT